MTRFAEGVAVVVIAAVVAATAVSAAKATPQYDDARVTDIKIVAQDPADQAGPATFYKGGKLKAVCQYGYAQTGSGAAIPWVNVKLYVLSTQAVPLVFWTTKGCFSETCTADWYVPTNIGTGTVGVGCMVTRLDGPDLKDANPANNKKETSIVIKPRPVKAGTAQAPVARAGEPKLPMLPDITSGSGVVIGGKSAAWGSSVTVDVKDAHSVNMNNSGLCQFAIKHTARNIGFASTGGFDSVWKNSAVPGSAGRFWLPIDPGSSKEETDLVTLKPGQNLLHLTLDNLEKVKEMNETKNKFRIIVNVTGSGGPKPGLVPPPESGPQSGSPASPRAPSR